MKSVRAALLKSSRSKDLWSRGVEIQGAARTLFIKHYKPKRGWKAFKYLWRRSQALRSWQGAYAIEIRNIRAVRAVAAIEQLCGDVESDEAGGTSYEKVRHASVLGRLPRRLSLLASGHWHDLHDIDLTPLQLLDPFRQGIKEINDIRSSCFTHVNGQGLAAAEA